ncbi:cytochrome c [Flavihumibacter rivuli]|uniref:c-type cytochrome n=1 Tax=Flavihumibacter rivuli TaxID=2838156 RepID=UPI001BDE4435|nr:c-type cytochrome [Flavihumibacter rivuli]ULQ56802.1 cytochrome c [Flavihumibacter rivuli]
MKKLLFIAGMLGLIYACGGADTAKEENKDATQPAAEQAATPSSPEKGIGKFSAIELGDKLDAAMATKGEQVYDVKCAACHKLTDEKLVGPGWKGVTQRNKPEWIMNFVTNVDEMLDKDPKAQAQLEICMVRMPNQSLSDDDARHILEFMRKNDGVK